MPQMYPSFWVMILIYLILMNYLILVKNYFDFSMKK